MPKGKTKNKSQKSPSSHHTNKQSNKQHNSNKKWKKSYESIEEREFCRLLEEENYKLVIVDGDGNCLFRAIADQLQSSAFIVHSGEGINHFNVRNRIVDYIENNREHFALFVEEEEGSVDDYICGMRIDGTWGGHQELYAASQCFNVNIVVHQLNRNESESKSEFSLMRYILPAADSRSGNGSKEVHLSYHGDCHYNSVKFMHKEIKMDEPELDTGRKNKSSKSKISIEQRKEGSIDIQLQQFHTSIQKWQVQSVLQAFPGRLLEIKEVVGALENSFGDINNAIEILCGAQIPHSAALDGNQLKDREGTSEVGEDSFTTKEHYTISSTNAMLSNVIIDTLECSQPEVKSQRSESLPQSKLEDKNRPLSKKVSTSISKCFCNFEFDNCLAYQERRRLERNKILLQRNSRSNTITKSEKECASFSMSHEINKLAVKVDSIVL